MILTHIPPLFEAYRAQYPGLSIARVCQQEKGLYQIVGPSGEQSARVSGRFQYDARTVSDYPAVGDYVMADGSGTAVIHAVLPRKTVFLRKAAGETKERRRSGRRIWGGAETADGAELEAREARKAARAERRAAEEVEAASCPRELVDRLRAFRTATAKAQRVSAFVVFPQKTLYAMAAAQPADLRELERVPGFGPRRAERYGAEILRIVAEWKAEAGETLLGREEGAPGAG